MVVVKEATGMFWGVTLDTGKRYTQTVERSFHISMAALEPKQGAGAASPNVCVMLQHEKSDYLMCTLSQDRPYQQELDLNFTQGEEVTFYLNGTGTIHLTGYLMDEGMLDDTMDRGRFGDTFETTGDFSDDDEISDDESDEDDEDEDDSEEDSDPVRSTTFADLETTQSTDDDDAEWTEARKRKLKHALKAAKKIRKDGAQGDDDDDEDEEDDSMDMTSSTMDTSQFSDEEDESDEESETPVTTPSKKGGQGTKQAKQQSAKLAASGGKVVKQNTQPQSLKKAKGQTPKGQTPKGQTPKLGVKQEQKSPAVKLAKKGGEKGKAKSEPPTPSAPKSVGKAKTPKVENGPAKTTAAEASPNQTPGLSKSAKKRQKQKEKKRLSAEIKKE